MTVKGCVVRVGVFHSIYAPAAILIHDSIYQRGKCIQPTRSKKRFTRTPGTGRRAYIASGLLIRYPLPPVDLGDFWVGVP